MAGYVAPGSGTQWQRITSLVVFDIVDNELNNKWQTKEVVAGGGYWEAQIQETWLMVRHIVDGVPTLRSVYPPWVVVSVTVLS